MNYTEQVNKVIENKFMFNKITELDPDWFIDFVEANPNYDFENENIYQFYLVDLAWGYTEDDIEIKKLGIFYWEAGDTYVLPVDHFGTPWHGVEEVDFTEE